MRVQGASEAFYTSPEAGEEFSLDAGHFCKAIGTGGCGCLLPCWSRVLAHLPSCLPVCLAHCCSYVWPSSKACRLPLAL